MNENSGLLLSDEQKISFARWLELQISTSEGIQKQMTIAGFPDVMQAKERVEQAACQVVLRMITSGESMSIG